MSVRFVEYEPKEGSAGSAAIENPIARSGVGRDTIAKGHPGVPLPVMVPSVPA
jgi:hypothetical protein